jgi:hypothetical protein
MANLEKIMEKEVSRRSFLRTTGIGLGVAAGALVFGTGLAGADTPAAPAGAVSDAPFPYVALDPEEARLRAHAAYYKAGCSYATFYAIMSMLREKVGGPYNQIPLRMLGYGRAGAASWGTLCGTLNGAGASINLITPDADTNKLLSEVIGWYTVTDFPTKKASDLGIAGGYTYTSIAYPKIDLVTSTSDSPLCHVSVAKWITKSGFKLTTPERKERCARLCGDVAFKTVELLNAWKAGTFVPVFQVSSDTANCLSCHDGTQEGKMACMDCHGDPHK